MKFGPAAAIALLIAAFVPCSVSAAQFTTGDVIVGTSIFHLGIPDEGLIKIVSPSGTLKSEIPVSPHHMRDLNVHNDTLFGWSAEVFTISTAGVLTPAGFVGPFLFDASGNRYSMTLTGTTLEKHDPSAALINTWSLPNRPVEMDLAADQCTLYYLISSAGAPKTVERYNLCASQPLPALNTTLPPQLGNIRVLPGNEILVGTTDGVLRIAPSGQFLRTYAAAGGQIALDPDGRSFWAAGGDSVIKFDLDSGSILTTSDRFGGFLVDSLTVAGEPRAALSGAAAIPTASEWMLIALGIALVAVGMIRFHSATP